MAHLQEIFSLKPRWIFFFETPRFFLNPRWIFFKTLLEILSDNLTIAKH